MPRVVLGWFNGQAIHPWWRALTRMRMYYRRPARRHAAPASDSDSPKLWERVYPATHPPPALILYSAIACQRFEESCGHFC